MTRTIPFHFQQYPIAIAPSPTTAKTSTTSVASIVGKPLLISLHTKSKMSRVQSHVTTSMPISKKQRSPLEVLRSILFEEPGGNSDNNSSTSTLLTKENNIKNATISFQTPLKTDMEDYDMESVRAIRASDVERLRELHRRGKSLDACNAFGESLLHMACRRGDVKVVRFLVEEIRVRSDRCDDFGRNPLHDAMWTSTPNTEVIDVLIDHIDPSMFLAEDVRGNTPFAYARREHDVKWIEFLEQRREKLRQRYNAFLSLKNAETTSRTTSAVPAESGEVASTERKANADEKRSMDATTSG